MVCGRTLEDGDHLFFKCKYVKHLWANIDVDQHRHALADIYSAREVVRYIMNLQHECQMKVAVSMCTWWNERDAIREGNRKKDVFFLAQSVEFYVQEIMEIHRRERKCM